METAFLPVTREEMLERGWDQVDFAFVSGDAYVDHPSFRHGHHHPAAGANGYKVGVIAQPGGTTPKHRRVRRAVGVLRRAATWTRW